MNQQANLEFLTDKRIVCRVEAEAGTHKEQNQRFQHQLTAVESRTNILEYKYVETRLLEQTLPTNSRKSDAGSTSREDWNTMKIGQPRKWNRLACRGRKADLACISAGCDLEGSPY